MVVDGLPVSIDLVEVATTITRATLGVDALVKVDPTTRMGAGERVVPGVGLLPGSSYRDLALDREAIGSGECADMGADPGIEPGVGTQDVLGVSGQALTEREAGISRQPREVIELWPWALGIDVVGGERADATPIVDSRAE
ncbi:unannotated protein [freshwater metagenome]|uniref:Unannotated protein n=1 Tax=freshwater metagenome TaxID=449393 RepID=A0A6J7C2W5_9ZZZZ